MSSFITFRDEEGGVLHYYVLQREFPHYVAILESQPSAMALAHSGISGHYLWLRIIGTLRGAVIPSYKDVANEMQSVCDEMANWYFENRIKPDEKKYKKWKIISNDTSAGK